MNHVEPVPYREWRPEPVPAAGDWDEVLVVGLGRFGSALGATLEHLGYEVLGVDADARAVQEHAGSLTHVVEADSTSATVLEQLGARDFACAVVCIGGDIEASILTTAALADLGVPNIWAKAITTSHGRILRRVGAHSVVFPEHDMGVRVAHAVTGRMLDYMELDEGFALVETMAPRETFGKTLAEAGLRAKYDVTVVFIKPRGESFTYATPDTRMKEGDILLVAGETKRAEAFAEIT
ncbi:MAG TPA: TrkA family potassium uptake protein [Acidimicrobiales bacterium]|nr:TrkA family potassium uptake protein [Acidimicrobiales bacterium]